MKQCSDPKYADDDENRSRRGSNIESASNRSDDSDDDDDDDPNNGHRAGSGWYSYTSSEAAETGDEDSDDDFFDHRRASRDGMSEQPDPESDPDAEGEDDEDFFEILGDDIDPGDQESDCAAIDALEVDVDVDGDDDIVRHSINQGDLFDGDECTEVPAEEDVIDDLAELAVSQMFESLCALTNSSRSSIGSRAICYSKTKPMRMIRFPSSR